MSSVLSPPYRLAILAEGRSLRKVPMPRGWVPLTILLLSVFLLPPPSRRCLNLPAASNNRGAATIPFQMKLACSSVITRSFVSSLMSGIANIFPVGS